jgi:hypothetical protein
MAETNQNFELHQGDTKDLEITIENGEGGRLDLTGSRIEWRLYRSVTTAALITKTTDAGGIEIADAPGGICLVHLESSETDDLPAGKYQHEAIVTDVRGYTATVLTGFAQVYRVHG